MTETGLEPLLRVRVEEGLGVLGICAGAVLLDRYGLLELGLERNAYGSQRESFVAPLNYRPWKREVRGVFIRAPRFRSDACDHEPLAEHQGETVAVERGCRIACAFHPELSGEDDLLADLLRRMVPVRDES